MKRILTLSALLTLTIISLVQAAPFAYVSEVNPIAGGAGQVDVVDLATNTVVTTIPTSPASGSMEATPNGSEVWLLSQQTGLTQIIDTATNTIVATPNFGVWIGMAFSPDSTRALNSAGMLRNDIDSFITGELNDGTDIIGSDHIFLAGGPNCR